MCDPVTAAGLALSAGGTYLQSREAVNNENRATAAKNQAFTQNMGRNRQFAAEAGSQAANNVQNQGREKFDENRQEEAEKQVQAFNDVRTQPDYNTGLVSNAPKNVVLARQSASEDAAAKTDRDVENNAALQGYGNALFNGNLSQSNFARLFGGIQDKAGANTRMLPLEMNAAANNAQKAPSLFPSLMKAAGSAANIFGAAGGSFSNTIPGQMPPGVFGPGAPVTSYGIFMDKKPVDLFGYQLSGRYS
jgi:hypothetical protein